MKLLVSQVWSESGAIKGFELVDPDGADLPTFGAGAHLSLHLPGGMTRQYSLCGDPAEVRRYELGVLHVVDGRGGSAYMHDRVARGTVIEASPPRNGFPLDESGENYILIAGGIGITPLLSMAYRLHAIGRSYVLYHLSRRRAAAGYQARLGENAFAGRAVAVHNEGDPERRLNITALLRDPPHDGRIYCCGPAGLMAEVRAASMHWPVGRVHFETFSPQESPRTVSPVEDSAFEIELARSKRIITVSAAETLLMALRNAGITILSSCESGICGTCIVDVLEGRPDHRDQILNDEERKHCMIACCSRSVSRRLVLDL